MWWHTRRNQISSFGRNGLVHLNRPGGVSSVDCWQPRCAASAVVMLHTPCSEVVWRVLATHSIRQFPLHFPSRASPRAITFQLDSTHTHHGQIYCHNTDYVRINGHDRTITVILAKHSTELGTAVAQWLRCCATNRKVAGSIPAGVSWFFVDIISFRSHYGPGVDSASNGNEYQVYFLGVKAAGASGWQPTTILCRCHEIWEP